MSAVSCREDWWVAWRTLPSLPCALWAAPQWDRFPPGTAAAEGRPVVSCVSTLIVPQAFVVAVLPITKYGSCSSPALLTPTTGFNTRRCTCTSVHGFCFFWLFPMVGKGLRTLWSHDYQTREGECEVTLPLYQTVRIAPSQEEVVTWMCWFCWHHQVT